jgi:uncharacterized protein YjbI with pentapeptide repeats
VRFEFIKMTDEEQPPSWIRRILLIVVASGVLAVLAALAWPTIEKSLGLTAVNPSRFWVAIIVATTFSITCSLVYFVAKKSLWDFLDLLIVPLALAIIGAGFAAQQQARQTQLEQQRDKRAQAVEEQRAQNEALQAYLDQMNNLMLEKGLLRSKVGDPVFTLALARTTTGISQFDGEHNQAVTRFLSDSRLSRDPALLAKADLEGAELPGAVLPEANLAGTILKGANLTEAVLSSAVFSATEEVGEDTNPIMADLTRADLTKATLLEADLTECTLDRANLTKATLLHADLSGAVLQNANLTNAALLHADLSSPPGLQTGNLQDTPLWALKERSTNLTHANLSHAALQEANLSGAFLQKVALTDANLTGANLTDAYLGDADLTDAKGWTTEQLRAARSFEGATMPDGQTLKSDKAPHGPTFEEWLKDKEGRGKNRENSGSS